MTIITIKNLQYAEFASEETHCYQATIYVDGNRFCKGQNDGHGGCDNYWSIAGDEPAHVLATQIAALDAKIKVERADDWKTEERPDGSEYSFGPDFEWMVGDAIAEALILKDMKADFRRHWIFTKPGKDGLFTIKNHKETAHLIPDHMEKKYPGAVILNNLPIDEALVIFRAKGA